MSVSRERILVNVFLPQIIIQRRDTGNLGRPLKGTEVVFGNTRKNASRPHAEKWQHKSQLGLQMATFKCSLPCKSTGAYLLHFQNSQDYYWQCMAI